MVFVELDAELGQAWILGPWVAGAGEAWVRFAGSLVDAALAQVPATFTARTLSGHTDNIRLAELAGQLGWRPVRYHLLMADRSLIDGWPDDEATNDLRPGTADDVATVEVLHEAEFAGTYATAGQLLRGSDVDDGNRGACGRGDGALNSGRHDAGHGEPMFAKRARSPLAVPQTRGSGHAQDDLRSWLP